MNDVLTLAVAGVRVPVYGLLLAAAGAAGIAVYALREGARPGGWLAVLAVPLMLLVSRAVFVLAEFSTFRADMLPGALRLGAEGGLSMTGAALGFALAARLSAGISRARSPRQADSALLAFAAFLAVARVAEFATLFSDEYGPWSGLGYGRDISFSLPLLASVPALVIGADGASFLRVSHLEALGALAVLFTLWPLSRRLRAGDTARLGVLALCAWQLLMESLRADGHMMWGFVHAQQVFAAIAAVAALCAMASRCGRRRRGAAVIAGGVLLIGVCLFLEFALDRNQITWEWVLSMTDSTLYMAYLIAVCALTGLGVVCLAIGERARGHHQN